MKLLMMQDIPVYNIESGVVLEEALCPFMGNVSVVEAYQCWVDHRVYLKSNRAAERILKQFGGEDTFEAKRRLSLSDSYWIKHDYDRDVKFADVTPYLNKFSEGFVVEGGVRSSSVPEFVLGGSQPKVWKRGSDGTTYLRKVELPEQVYAEMLAVKLLRKSGLGIMNSFVITANGKLYADKFELTKETGEISVINLVNMTNLDRSLVQFDQLGIAVDGYDVTSVISGYRLAGVRGGFEKDAVCQVIADAIVGNVDRRTNNSNWAVFVDNKLGERRISHMYDFNWANPLSPNLEMLRLVASGVVGSGMIGVAVEFAEKVREVCANLGLWIWRKNTEALLLLLGDGRGQRPKSLDVF